MVVLIFSLVVLDSFFSVTSLSRGACGDCLVTGEGSLGDWYNKGTGLRLSGGVTILDPKAG